MGYFSFYRTNGHCCFNCATTGGVFLCFFDMMVLWNVNEYVKKWTAYVRVLFIALGFCEMIVLIWCRFWVNWSLNVLDYLLIYVVNYGFDSVRRGSCRLWFKLNGFRLKRTYALYSWTKYIYFAYVEVI